MINLDLHKNRLIVTFPYSDALVQAMKRIDGGRFRKDPMLGAHWRFPLTKLSALLHEFPDAWQHPRVSDWVALRNKALQLKAMGDAPQPLGIALELRRHQRVAVNFLKTLRRGICSAGVGTGKTFSGIAWAVDGGYTENGAGRRGVLVVTKAAGKYKYASEILRALPRACVVILEGERGPFPTQEQSDWVVINYDLLNPRIEQIKAFGFAAIIFSESHKLKNPAALRTKVGIELGKEDAAILLETASLIPNRNAELFSQLCVLGYLDSTDDYWSFHIRFCLDPKNPKKYIKGRKLVWDFTHSCNSAELHEFIAPFTYTITKEEALPDLPEVYFTPTLVEPSNLDEYEHASEEFLEWVAEEKGFDAVDRAKRALAITRLNALLQLSAIGNTEAAEDLLESYVEAHEKVVVFSSYRKPLEDLYGKYEHCAVTIMGGQGAKGQFRAQEDFQNNKDVLIALCSTEAAGESITLTAASTCIAVSMPWSPEQFAQMYGRLHRDGQKNAVEVIPIIGRRTIQIDQIEVLYGKAMDISKVVTGKDRSPNSEALRKILREVKGAVAEDILFPVETT